MKLLADESVDGQIVDRLRSSGHSVEYVAEMSPGITDEDVLKHSSNLQLVLLTSDKDFGELVYRQQHVTQGVILLRLPGMPPQQKAATVDATIGAHESRFHGNFSVISPGALRIRRTEN